MTSNSVRTAEHVYVLTTDAYRTSRCSRAQWYLNHLNKTVQIQPKQTLSDFSSEMEIVSILPSHYQDYVTDDHSDHLGSNDVNDMTTDSGSYFISANTNLTFFARRYRLVFVIDMSPSTAVVDIQHNSVLYTEAFTVLSRCLRGVSQPFYIPGSPLLFEPEIFITVIGYSPFIGSDNYQVFAQGLKINAQNINDFLTNLQKKINVMIDNLFVLSKKAKSERDDNQSESDALIGSLFEENENKKPAKTCQLMNPPDISMLNILHFGIIALQLMPEISSAGIVIITDGMMSLANANVLDSMLNQLRYHSISCSFLQLGSAPHPHSCFGYVPNFDFMKFLSIATFGAYLSVCPELFSNNGSYSNQDFNVYHRALLAWNFQRALYGFKSDINLIHIRNSSEWSIDNAYFYSNHDCNNLYLNFNRETRDQQVVRNKQKASTVSAPLTQVLSSRLREGYTIKSVNYHSNANEIEVKLLLAWKQNVNIEYNITSSLSSTSKLPDLDENYDCHYELIVEGNYNFLHDITCASKKPIKSGYRAATIKLYWTTLRNLNESDNREAHVHNFTKNSVYRNVPESIKNGVPLFYMPPNCGEPEVSSKNVVHSQFTQYWRAFCTLDVNILQKLMHTHQINVILEHDMPLPKYLHLPNNSGRYQTIQCRQALAALNVLLKESTSFVLLENHSYVKLLYDSQNDSPYSYYLIRVISQPPSILIYLAFIGGTSGYLMHQIVSKLKDQLETCKFSKRTNASLNAQKVKNSETSLTNDLERKSPTPLQRELVPVNCCTILKTPIDKVLIRYNKIPEDFITPFDKQFSKTYNNGSHNNNISLNMIQSLRNYLYHQRWIWQTHTDFNTQLNFECLARILSVITKMRLREGFNFAYNDSGIINMIYELPMKDNSGYDFTCAIQYIIFPPHINYLKKDCLSDEEDLDLPEGDGEVQLITECWVEPQIGISNDMKKRSNNILNGLTYKDILQVFLPHDSQAICCLLSLEHLLIMCQTNDTSTNSSNSHSELMSSYSQFNTQSSVDCFTSDMSSQRTSYQSERIKTIQFNFDLISLLRKCQQAIILFPTLIQNYDNQHNSDDHSSDSINEIFFELLFEKFEHLHNTEIDLNPKDINSFIDFINNEKKDKPTLHSNPNDNDFGKFKCFSKKLNSNSVLITIIPASYKDLSFLLSHNNREYPTGKSFLPLPLYIYKCSFTSLTEQLVNTSNEKNWKDIYIDNTCKSVNDDVFKTFHQVLNESQSESDYLSKSSKLKQFCRTFQIIYWNCMRQAIYRSLQMGKSIHQNDISNFVKQICDQFVHKINITEYLVYLCCHFKENIIKSNHNDSNEAINYYIKSNNKFYENEMPLNLKLFRLTKCEERKDLHTIIKDNFHNIINHYFTPIPYFSQFYFYYKQNVDPNYYKNYNKSDINDSQYLLNCETVEETSKSSTNICANNTNSEKEDKVSEDSLSNYQSTQTISKPAFEENCSLSLSNSSRFSSHALELPSDQTSSINNNSNTIQSTPTANTNIYIDSDSLIEQPLYLYISCSIKAGSVDRECALNTLPTCIEEIFSILDTKIPDCDLQDLEITLNLNYLTQYNENELHLDTKTSKTCSASLTDENKNSPNGNHNLIVTQVNALEDCISKINWLLRDQISSIALESYPITESTLDMVVWHIERSITSEYCFSKQFDLKFVFGSASDSEHNISLNRFCDFIGQIKLNGYQLKKEGKYYYILYDNDSDNADEQQTISSNYFASPIMPSNSCMGFNDNTQLRQLCYKNIDDNDTVNSNQSKDSRKNFKLLLTSKPQSHKSKSQLFKSSIDVKRETHVQKISEDSYEEENIHVRRKHVVRKHFKSRSASVPPNSNNSAKSEVLKKSGQSLPESDFILINNCESNTKTTIECLSDTNISKTSSDDNPFVIQAEKLNNNVSIKSVSPENSKHKIHISLEDEAGYEGDSDSNSDGENFNWLAVDNKYPFVPKFWLIMKIEAKKDTESVLLYFHSSPREKNDDSFVKGINIYKHVVSMIDYICKTVNQVLLLESLHDSRMCENLLVPLEDNDPFKTKRHVLNRTQTKSDGLETETEMEMINPKLSLKLMKTNFTFSPGIFSCDIIWKKHFPLHPRLQSNTLRGISAMRTVLNSFSVNNRKNLYVYQESSGAVFYLRLYEIDCTYHNFINDQKSLTSSRTPSESSLIAISNKKESNEDLVETKNKNESNNNQIVDNISLISHTSSRIQRTNNEKPTQQQCILLHVHGIGEPGQDIVGDMVPALQKKLDEAILDILIILLSRNPHTKLNAEDVSFIQKSNKEPIGSIRFTVDIQFQQYISAIKVYLRQNLLTVTHNPKYTESQSDHHFKAYCESDAIENSDDIFLYHRQQASGSDCKGIACIIMSIVDTNGHLIQNLSCPPVNNYEINELKVLISSKFDDILNVRRYEQSSSAHTSSHTPSQIAMFQFHIWCVGKIDIQTIYKMIELNIKHALWDLIIEFKLLRASLISSFNILETSVSEPSTPRGRRIGHFISSNQKSNDNSNCLENSKDVSLSVPIDINKECCATKKYSDSELFVMSNLSSTFQTYEKEVDMKENLLCLVNSMLRPWLEFGKELEVASVVKQTYTVTLRHSICHILSEFKAYLKNINSKMDLNAFKKSDDFNYIVYDFNYPESSTFESVNDIIILFTPQKLWKLSISSTNITDNLDNLSQFKNERTKQRFLPHYSNVSDVFGKPLSTNSEQIEDIHAVIDDIKCIAPRKKFILLFIKDKSITLFIYNWSNEYISNICQSLSNIICWHNSRSALLQSFVLQKSGIFHNQPFKRKISDNVQTNSNNVQIFNALNYSSIRNQKQRVNSFPSQMNEDSDLLIKHHNPVMAAQQHSQNKKQTNNSMTSTNSLKVFRNYSNLTPLHSYNSSFTGDILSRYGNQIRHSDSYLSVYSDLFELSKVWHIQGTKLHSPVVEKTIKQVKKIGRLNHYCLTPLLFSPKWRLSVSPVRDHSIHTLDIIEEESKVMYIGNHYRQRLRHSSGGYMRPNDDFNNNSNRSRRLSGPAISGSAPKVTPEESWHFAVCTHYMQEYIQYLQTLGFSATQMRSQKNLTSKEDIFSANYKNILKQPFSRRKFSSKIDSEHFYLTKSLHGGLLVFEVGFCEPYVYSYLYSFDSKRFDLCNKTGKSIANSFSSTFLDELERIKVTMHLHSFTYDYHLRTVHSYISGRQLIFKQGYHLISFLDDFIKYYQKAPNYARNLVYLGHVNINNTVVASNYLYNYIISHNQLYGMKVFRMNSLISSEEDLELANEYVLVELSSHRVPYKDTNDIRQVDNFDVGVLITKDSLANNLTNKNTLSLKFFVLLTSQRELFPKLFNSHFGASVKGSFKPIRVYSSQPSSGTHSRKSSTITEPTSDGSLTDSSSHSIKETNLSSLFSSSGNYEKSSLCVKAINALSTSATVAASAGMCDEEITYMGYFSNFETVMLQILHDKASETEAQLSLTVNQAAIDCRRDHLWSSLLPRKTNSETEFRNLTFNEFDELLKLITIVSIEKYDRYLLSFIGHHLTWYHGLIKVLANKSELFCRNFSTSDAKINKYVFSHTSCLDSFILVSILEDSSNAELCLVLKNPKAKYIESNETFQELCSQQCHTLIEDFVSGCVYYMWTTLT